MPRPLSSLSHARSLHRLSVMGPLTSPGRPPHPPLASLITRTKPLKATVAKATLTCRASAPRPHSNRTLARLSRLTVPLPTLRQRYNFRTNIAVPRALRLMVRLCPPQRSRVAHG